MRNHPIPHDHKEMIITYSHFVLDNSCYSCVLFSQESIFGKY